MNIDPIRKIATAHWAFPKCPIEGSTEPTNARPDSRFTVFAPNKCIDCAFSFELSCYRLESDGTPPPYYKNRDWGFCGITGGDKLSNIEVKVRRVRLRYSIPTKCANCNFLKFELPFGLQCSRFQESHRTLVELDWSEINSQSLSDRYNAENTAGVVANREDSSPTAFYWMQYVDPPIDAFEGECENTGEIAILDLGTVQAEPID